jgi:uncharacterized protein (TIGR02284 family)
VSDRPQLARLLGEQAEERNRLAAELEEGMRRLVPPAEQLSGIVPQLEHGWSVVEPAAFAGDPAAILAAIESGEAATTRRYAEALRAGLPPELEGVVAAQQRRLEELQGRLRALRDRPAA